MSNTQNSQNFEASTQEIALIEMIREWQVPLNKGSIYELLPIIEFEEIELSQVQNALVRAISLALKDDTFIEDAPPLVVSKLLNLNLFLDSLHWTDGMKDQVFQALRLDD